MSVTSRRLRVAVRFADRDMPASVVRVTGVTLTLYRIAAGVSAKDVASVMDVSKQFISKIEAEGATIEVAGRYRAAVDTVAGS